LVLDNLCLTLETMKEDYQSISFDQEVKKLLLKVVEGCKDHLYSSLTNLRQLSDFPQIISLLF